MLCFDRFFIRSQHLFRSRLVDATVSESFFHVVINLIINIRNDLQALSDQTWWRRCRGPYSKAFSEYGACGASEEGAMLVPEGAL